MIKDFNTFLIENILNESVNTPDLEDVLAKKLGVEKLHRFTRNDDGSYVSSESGTVYPKSSWFNKMIDNGWTFIDFYQNGDTDWRRAYRCYFDGKNPKDVFSKYIAGKVSVKMESIKEWIDSLPESIKKNVVNGTQWIMLSPDKGICAMCSGYASKYRNMSTVTTTISFTGLRKYGTITSKTKDAMLNKKRTEVKKKIDAYWDSERTRRSEEKERIRQEEDEKNAKIELSRKEMSDRLSDFALQDEEWRKNNPKDAEICQYILDDCLKSYKKYQSICGVISEVNHHTYMRNDFDDGYHNSSEDEDKLYHAKAFVVVHDGRVYFPKRVTMREVTEVMMKLYDKFGIDTFYDYDSDYAFPIDDDDRVFGPAHTFNEWKESAKVIKIERTLTNPAYDEKWRAENPSDAKIADDIHDKFFDFELLHTGWLNPCCGVLRGRIVELRLPHIGTDYVAIVVRNGKIYKPIDADVPDMEEIMKYVSEKYGIDKYYDMEEDYNDDGTEAFKYLSTSHSI